MAEKGFAPHVGIGAIKDHTRVLIIGGEYPVPVIIMAEFEEKFGKNVEVLTLEQAQAAGLKPSDFANIPAFQLKANPMLLQSANQAHLTVKPSGKETRRERRARNRKNKKRK